MPFISMCYLLRRRKRLLRDSFINTIGVLYSQFKIKKKWAAAFNVIFMLRRIIYAFIFTLLAEYSAFQVISMNLMSLMMLCYILLVIPYIENRLNIIEVYNELTVLICSWHLFLFSEYLPDV